MNTFSWQSCYYVETCIILYLHANFNDHYINYSLIRLKKFIIMVTCFLFMFSSYVFFLCKNEIILLWQSRRTNTSRILSSKFVFWASNSRYILICYTIPSLPQNILPFFFLHYIVPLTHISELKPHGVLVWHWPKVSDHELVGKCPCK